MALVLADRVQETSTSTGTGSFTLAGAVTGYQTFAVIGNGNTTFYTIADQGGANWEVGIGTYSTSGPTLARTTVLSNSNGNTSPVNFTAGTKTVFVTYPSEQSVNLDASGNVSALGTVSSGTWQGTTVGVAYGGTGVTSSSGANSVVLRDANANITFNNFTSGFTAVTAAAGTTVLTVASTRTQVLIGSTTQTIQLPDATTLQLGQSFIFVNNSSGVLTITNNASATIDIVPPGGAAQLGATSIATSAGTWGIYSFLPGTYNFSIPTADFGNATITNAVWNGTTIGTAYGGTGLTTFTGANNALYSTGSSTLTAGTLPVPAGGTGITSATANGLVYGNGTSALQITAAGTTGQVLLGNTGSAPSWGSVPAGSITGTVPIANGGTGQTTAGAAFNALSPITTTGDLIVGNGSNSATRLGIGSTGQVLTVSGGTTVWSTPTTGGGTITRTDFTATAGQTVFTVSYTVGLIDVYRNGVKLATTDFTATNGTSFTLAVAANAGDIVQAVVFSSLNLYSTITYQVFNGDGTTTVFTMSSVPANSASLLVAISGVVQDPGTYTVSSTTLTFFTAPPSGTGNISVRYLGIASIGTVGSFSAGTTGLTPASATTGAVVLAGTLNVANGGTGLNTLASNRIPYGAGTSALASSSTFVFDGTNLGVGTASPSSVLHVSASAASSRIASTGANGSYLRFYSNNQTTNPFEIGQGLNTGTDNIGYVWNIANAAMSFGTNAAERMRIDSSGNVGIGTSTTTDAGLTITTSVSRDGGWNAKLGLQSTGTNNYPTLLFSGCSSASRYGAIVQTASTSGATANQITSSILFVNTSSTAGNITFTTNGNVGTTGDTERMRIDSSGNVGIGTSSPNAKLDVAVSSGVNLALTKSGGAYLGFYEGTTARAAINGLSGADGLAFATGSALTERMRIDSSGRVTTPFQPSFLVARDTTSISSGTFVVFQTTQNNVGSCYNTSNGTFTAPVAGLYSISFGFLASVSNTVYRFTIYRNNATFVVGSNVDPGQIRLDCSSGIDYLQGAKTLNIYLSANDYLNVHYSSDNGSALTDSTWAFFSGFLVG
jgi:hypothetical protein